MILPRCNNLLAFALLQLLARTYAQTGISSPFDCHITSGDRNYDLTPLAGERTVSRTRNSPPTEIIDTVAFDLCADLHTKESTLPQDQCPAGTRACLTKTNRKSSEADRIVAVVQVAMSSKEMAYSTISSPKGVVVTFQGASYPDPSTSEEVSQTFNVKLLCSSSDSEPSFASYNHSDLWVEWSTPSACEAGTPPSTTPDDKPDGDIEDGDEGSEPSGHMGSGLGYFFLILLLAFIAYFALGAYYNYSTYGASGLDLIPHRDFWREVPYMLRDVVAHLCSSVRSRSASRGGYIAV